MAVSILAVACSDDDSSPTSPMNGMSNVRVLHTSYDAPAVDVWVNGETAIMDLAYGESSGYAALESGMVNIQVTPNGMMEPVVINADLELMEDAEYTVIAAGDLGSIQAVVAVDDRTPDSGQAKIRFAHLSPDAPAVDIKLNDGNGAAVFANAAFGDVADYELVPEGTYTFAVTATGSTAEVVIFDPIMVQAGMVYTVVAHGTLDAMDMYDFAARVFVDNDMGADFVDLTTYGSAQLMVVHASPDAPAVDLLVNDMTAGTNLAFPANTGYMNVLATMKNIKVNVAGTGTNVINADLGFTKGMHYSLFAVDAVASLSALLLEDDMTAPAMGTAHVRFVHLSPDAPAVDITLTDGTVVFGNVAFKEFAGFAPVSAGMIDLQVRLAGTDTVVLDLPGIDFMDGMIYTVFAKGFAAGSGDQALGAEIIMNN